MKINSDHENLITNAIHLLKPFIELLNFSQKDGANWIAFYSEFIKLSNKTKDAGKDKLFEILEKRKVLIKNPIIGLYNLIKFNIELEETEIDIISKWLKALNIADFEKYLFNLKFNIAEDVPGKLLGMINYVIPGIAISKSSVERCFGIHKRMHSDFRACLSSDIVEDMLFIRYAFAAQISYDNLVIGYDSITSLED